MTDAFETILDIKAVSINCAYRTANGRVYLTKKARDYIASIKSKLPADVKISGPVKLEVHFHFSDGRKRDTDNHLKAFIDALKHHIIDDDSNVMELHVKQIRNSVADRIWVKISSIN